MIRWGRRHFLYDCQSYKYSCVSNLSSLQVRRRSKACRAGLKEYDELVAIGHHMCAELSHAEAMTLIDTQSATLNLRVKRSEHGLPERHTHSLTLLHIKQTDACFAFSRRVICTFPGPLRDSTPHLTLVALHLPAPPP